MWFETRTRAEPEKNSLVPFYVFSFGVLCLCLLHAMQRNKPIQLIFQEKNNERQRKEGEKTRLLRDSYIIL